jgi:hypothetical protein
LKVGFEIVDAVAAGDNNGLGLALANEGRES